jgi:hypothetical protein
VIAELEERLVYAADRASYIADASKDPHVKLRATMVAIAATIARKNLLLDTGQIGPDLRPREPEHADASDIRRLAEEVASMGVRALPSPGDLVSEGERAWLGGNTVEADHLPVIDVPAAAPAPALTIAPRPATVAPIVRPEPMSNAITTDARHSRQTAWELITPPGER